MEEVRRDLDGGAGDLTGVHLLPNDVGSEQTPTIHADNAILALKNAHRQLKAVCENSLEARPEDTMSNDSFWMRTGNTPIIEQGTQAGESVTSEVTKKLKGFAPETGLRRFRCRTPTPRDPQPDGCLTMFLPVCYEPDTRALPTCSAVSTSRTLRKSLRVRQNDLDEFAGHGLESEHTRL